MESADIPFAVHWFEDPSAITRALGVEVDLPDLTNESPAYWDTFGRTAWRQGLIGKVAMTAAEMATGDPDWIRLQRLGDGIEIWFDVEEGVVFRCVARQVAQVVALIRRMAHAHDLKLEAGGESLVTASQAMAGGNLPFGRELRTFLAPAGFSWDRCRWVLPPASRMMRVH